MTVPLHPHGAARVAAGLGPEAPASPAFDAAMRDQLARAEVSEAEAHLAWELARFAPELGPADQLALATLALLVRDAQARGSTRLAIDPPRLVERARALGAPPSLAEALPPLLARRAAPPLDRIFGGPEDRRPLVVDDGHLYAERLLVVERRLAALLRRRTALDPAAAHEEAAPAEGAIARALAGLRERPAMAGGAAIVLTDEQEEAVRVALRAPLAVISGGPGTGKTSIVVAVLRAALAAGVADGPGAIALAAPTGKAADRMRRAIESSLASVTAPSALDAALLEALPTPRTLHRLLGWSPGRGRFRHHADNPLAERLVVVDESSMIDVFLMERLVASLHSEAHLVLLGDAEQLPSVAAGAVFRDLGRAPSIPSVRLTKSHRMDPRQPAGFNVLTVAAQVNAGTAPPLVEMARVEVEGGAAPEGAAGEGVRPVDLEAMGRLEALPEALDAVEGVALFAPTVAGREAFLDAWLAQRIDPKHVRAAARRTWRRHEGRIAAEEEPALEALFAWMERARLLCVTRAPARPTGAEAVNASLHRRLADARGVAAAPGYLLAGEPVLVHRNDYERGLFNGDQGLALWSEDPEEPGLRLHAVFRSGEGFVAYPADAIRASIELGYATTVHKAQGSEHDQVALLLPETDSPRLLTREIVYTAITRARRSVVIVGDPALLGRAVGRRIERSSGIAERLAGS